MKRIKVILIMALVVTVLVSANGFAAENTRISIDGNILEFNDTTGYPFVDENGRTQVPFRIALETFGAKVDWNI